MAVDGPTDESLRASAELEAKEFFPTASPEEMSQIVESIMLTPLVPPSSISPGSGTRPIDLSPPPSDTGTFQFEPGLRGLEQIQNFGVGVREALPIAGGVVGLGGGLPGSVAGAGLGGYARNAFRSEGDEPIDALRGLRDEASIELIGGSLFDAIPGGLSRVLRGDRKVAERYAEALQEFGLKPTLQEISNTSFVESFRTIIGSFPLFRKPFAKFQTQRLKDADRALVDFIEGASPDTLLMRRMAESGDLEGAKILNEKLSGEFLRGLDKGFRVLKEERDKSFDVMRSALKDTERAAELLGAPFVSKSSNTLLRLNKALQRAERNAQQVRPGTTGPKETETMKETVEFLEDIAGSLPEVTRFDKLVARKKRISRQIDRVGKEDAEAATLLTTVKEGVEEDIDVLLRQEPKLRKSYEETLDLSSDLLTMFESIASRAVKSVDKKLGRQGLQEIARDGDDLVLRNAGPQDIVTLMDKVANSKSPAAIRDFMRILTKGSGEQRSKKMLGDALGRKLSRAIDKAFKESPKKAESGTFEPETILKNMGLADPTSPEFAATVELFKAAGLNPNRTKKLVDMLDAMFSAKPGSAAQFIQRKAALTGIQGAVKGLLPGVTVGAASGAAATGGLASSGAVGLIATYLVTRSIGKTLTSPWRTKAVIAMADAARPTSHRARALVSLLTDPPVAAVLRPDSDDGFGNHSPAEDMKAEIEETLRTLRTKEGRDRFFKQMDEDLRGVFRPGKKNIPGGADLATRELTQEQRRTIDTPFPNLNR